MPTIKETPEVKEVVDLHELLDRSWTNGHTITEETQYAETLRHRLMPMSPPWPPMYLKGMAEEIRRLLKINLLEIVPTDGTAINQGEKFKGRFRISVSNGSIGCPVQFRNVKVVFRPGIYAQPEGSTPSFQKVFEFDEVNSLYPKDILVDFVAKKPEGFTLPVQDGPPENFTRVYMTGTFNPESLYHVRRWENFHTQIEES